MSIAICMANESPETLLSALAYRALMRETVSRDLDGALSENLDRLARQVLERIVAQAASQTWFKTSVILLLRFIHRLVLQPITKKWCLLKLIAFTRVIRANTETLRRLPAARAKALTEVTTAKGLALKERSEAVGEAQAFLGLRSVLRNNQELFVFGREWGAIEAQLVNKALVVIDRRIEKDGGEVWVEK